MRFGCILIQLRDVVELFLIPALALFLPWSLCFRVFKFLSKLDFLYRNVSLNAFEKFQSFELEKIEKEKWLSKYKLVTLVDHADLYLAWARRDCWLKKHITIEGGWPNSGKAAVLCTFHWGAGMWSLRHARINNLKAHILVASLKKENFPDRPVLHFYAKLRTKAIARELSRETLDSAASLRSVLKALKADEQVMAVVDVPADAVTGSTEVNLFGHVAKVPRALLRLAADNGLPVTVFTVGISMDNGHRFLNIYNLPIERNSDILTTQVFSYLDQVVKSEPAAWHFWGEADRFFVRKKY